MPKVALAVCDWAFEIADEDPMLVRALREQGVDADAIQWDSNADWSLYDMVVIRSTWDYHLRADEFLRWLSRVEQGSRVVNGPDVVRWNHNKNYLFELQAKGAPVMPTLRWPSQSPMPELPWDRFVVKPVIGATAHKTHRLYRSSSQDLDRALAVNAEIDTLLQPYVETIESEGEMSLIYFDRKFQYAIRKRPKAGDFRVQSDFGGTGELVEASPDEVTAAERVLAGVEGDVAFARVDLVRHEGEPRLMELEVIEPQLFLDLFPGAETALAKVLVGRL